MKPAAITLLCCATVLVCACKSMPAKGDQPAVIVNPTAESRAELQHVVSDMLFGADVLLADEALTETSVLIIERQRIRSLQNPPLSGRDLGRPERFQLFTTGTGCVLVHESNHARYELAEVECVPEE